jgi:hypothetical protein
VKGNFRKRSQKLAQCSYYVQSVPTISSTVTNSAATPLFVQEWIWHPAGRIDSVRNVFEEECSLTTLRFLCGAVRCVVTDIIVRSRGLHSIVLCRWSGGFFGSSGTRHSSLCSASSHTAGTERPCYGSIQPPVSPYEYLQHSEFHN